MDTQGTKAIPSILEKQRMKIPIKKILEGIDKLEQAEVFNIMPIMDSFCTKKGQSNPDLIIPVVQMYRSKNGHVLLDIPHEEKYNTPKNKFSRYHKVIKGAHVDVYDVLHAFDVGSHSIGHAIKKLLVAGKRGSKDTKQDYEEAIASINRAIEDLS